MKLREWLLDAQKEISHLERHELEFLLRERLGVSRAYLLAHWDDEIEETLEKQLEQDIYKLQVRVPVQYILGYAYFMDMCFKVNEHVLIPRFDTEYLVQAVLDRTDASVHTVLDLCTGSGIIAISLARLREDWEVYASDLSMQALSIAKENAQALGTFIQWEQGDLLTPWTSKKFDVIVSNPPYISREEYATLAPEVKKEPIQALVAEKNGLFFYQQLVQEAPFYLAEGGLLAVEIGWQQGQEVSALFRDNGFREVECLPDGQGHDRVVVGQYYGN